MKYTKNSPEWQEIITENKSWFSPRTLKFFGSTIFWATLTETTKGKGFITSEHNYSNETKLFSIRLITNTGIDTYGEYQGYETLAEALRELKTI